MHVVKVDGNSDVGPAGPVSNSSYKSEPKLHVTTATGLDPTNPAGPPPPSPPASVEQYDDSDGDDSGHPPTRFGRLGSTGGQGRHGHQSSATTTTSSLGVRLPQVQRSSTDTKGLRVITPPQAPSSSGAAVLAAAAHMSVDGYLQPPPPSLATVGSNSLSSAKPTRRNTTGSTPLTPKRFLSSSNHSKGLSQPFSPTDDAIVLGEGSIELASDIELHAERIRRERTAKRAKAQLEAEAALTARQEVATAAADTAAAAQAQAQAQAAQGQEQVLVGNLIGEDHANYVLMYNMLTGIRIAVSRCGAKIQKALTPEDFRARHKYSFDIVGNELTPSAKYDFKFKDYSPWVFRYLREEIFHIDPADYLLSLTAKYILSELGSPGKSGSFFYFSRDYRFIIKTIRHSEHKFLLSILKDYYEYVRDNPHTLLSRFYGLHRVKLPRGRKIHFVIMNNLFPPHKDVHETYDLKGSTVGRLYPEDKAAKNPRAVLKDLNWINRGKILELGPEKRALITEQLRRDAEFLKSVDVMDYSLLVGIHNMQRGNKDNVRKNTLKVFSPDIPSSRRPKHHSAPHHTPTGPKSPEAKAMRRAIHSSDPQRATVHLPDESPTAPEGAPFVFYQDEGGLRATNEANEGQDVIYYLGVIDILTPFSWVKKMESFWKGLKSDRHKISPVPPTEYGDRFFSFMKAIMRGGEGGERFKEDNGKEKERDMLPQAPEVPQKEETGVVLEEKR
ncbi:hypothetical protein CPB83DRAFT_766872 [Crepidotus variabilis]|uniref:1-phosphatidylinositol-4-phosphate 5-kinase n=1 Tax=Crepidotus variabilis TaxID=179855 RepID=A0A9P6JPD2_9AGAR|nr:hypothetical protein CPB83DRAFT_766872 [Crepidotus variabilis]